jgi:uncharacterized protein
VGLKVYLDSCIVIYLVEKHPNFSLQIENSMNSLSEVEYFVSSLTKMETMVMPLRTNDLQLQNLYTLFFDAQTLLSITKEVYEKATQLRADFPKLKTPDALHLATAIYNNCDEFWTNDDDLNKIAPSLVKNIL